jgi:hypothetical protein
MRKLTQLQYEVIFLYSKGLTFREIDKLLATSSKGIYNQVVSKDKGRVTRAKISRKINSNKYKEELNKYLEKVKLNNKLNSKYVDWIREKYIIPIAIAKVRFRNKYLNDSLDKSFKSYSKYKITFLKKFTQKVA